MSFPFLNDFNDFSPIILVNFVGQKISYGITSN